MWRVKSDVGVVHYVMGLSQREQIRGGGGEMGVTLPSIYPDV